MQISKDEGISSCLSKESQIKEQLKDLGDKVPDNEILSTILNALTDEQGNHIASRKEEAIPYIRLWSLVKPEGDRMKNERSERSERRKQLVSKQKERFEKFGIPKKKRKNMAKVRCYGYHNFGHYKKDCSNRKRGREDDYSTKEVKELETKKGKKEEAKR